MGRMERRALAVIAVAGLLVQSAVLPAASAGSSRGYGEGGSLLDFLALVTRYNGHNELFRIEGVCKSACTMFLAIRNVCIVRGAVLMFHAGRDVQDNRTGPDTHATRLMLSAYNTKLKAYILAGHHMDTSAFYALPASLLIDRFGYRECSRVSHG